MNKAIFLDRDGTINVEKNYLYRIEDFVLIPRVIEGLKMLQNAGFKLIIITNQSGIARGYYSERDFFILNKWMLNELGKNKIKIDKVYYCPHLPNAKIKDYKTVCDCRKPKIGLFKKAIEDFDLDITKCFTIGDKIRDCEICKEGCHGYLIENNESLDIINKVKNNEFYNVQYASSLYDAALSILKSETSI